MTGTDRLRGLRILHAAESFHPNVGGLELSVAALVRAQVSRGRVVAVATPLHPNAPDREDLDGAQVHRLPMAMAHVPGAYAAPTHNFFPPVPDPRFARAFADLVGRFRPDVIHARGWILYSVLGRRPPSRRPGRRQRARPQPGVRDQNHAVPGTQPLFGTRLGQVRRLRLLPLRPEGDSSGRRSAPTRIEAASRRRPVDSHVVGARRSRFGAPPGRPQRDRGDPDIHR